MSRRYERGRTKFLTLDDHTAALIGGKRTAAYRRALEVAGRLYAYKTPGNLKPAAWWCLADACAPGIRDGTAGPEWGGATIAAELEAAEAKRNLGERWFGKPYGGRMLAKLVAMVRGWDYVTAQAVLVAIRWYLESNPGDTEGWWLPEYRVANDGRVKVRKGRPRRLG